MFDGVKEDMINYSLLALASVQLSSRFAFVSAGKTRQVASNLLLLYRIQHYISAFITMLMSTFPCFMAVFPWIVFLQQTLTYTFCDFYFDFDKSTRP